MPLDGGGVVVGDKVKVVLEIQAIRQWPGRLGDIFPVIAAKMAQFRSRRVLSQPGAGRRGRARRLARPGSRHRDAQVRRCRPGRDAPLARHQLNEVGVHTQHARGDRRLAPGVEALGNGQALFGRELGAPVRWTRFSTSPTSGMSSSARRSAKYDLADGVRFRRRHDDPGRARS